MNSNLRSTLRVSLIAPPANRAGPRKGDRTMLANIVALLSLAVALGGEAGRARQGFARVALWAATAIIVLFAAALPFIAPIWPDIAKQFDRALSTPVTWWVIGAMLYFSLRRYWIAPPKVAIDPIAEVRAVAEQAQRLVHYVTDYRHTNHLFIGDLPDIQPTVIRLISVAMTFEKLGFGAPQIAGLETYQQAVAYQIYFERLTPLIRDRHIDEAKEASAAVAEAAVTMARRCSVEQFWTRSRW